MTRLEQIQAALFDRYRVDRQIGAGGMATVYLAHDLKHDRHLALKILNDELAASVGADRFLREIQLAAPCSAMPITHSRGSDAWPPKACPATRCFNRIAR